MVPLSRFLVTVWIVLLAASGVARAGVAVWQDEWRDEARDRVLPVKIHYPDTGGGPWPVVVFSHGLGGTREGYGYLGRYWAEQGFVVVHVQHPGSDAAVWRQALERDGVRGVKRAMQAAINDPDNLVNRPRDVSFVLDELTRRERTAAEAGTAHAGAWPLRGRLDLARVAVGGHSFGAYTALVVAGAKLPGVGLWLDGKQDLADPRVRAAVVLSAPRMGRRDPTETLGAVRVPLWVMTGTADTSRIDPQTKPEDRERAFEHATRVERWLVVFEGGTHMLFGGGTRPGGGAGLGEVETVAATATSPRRSPGEGADPERLAAIQQGTTAFLRAILDGDATARAWLAAETAGYRSLLQAADEFEHREAAVRTD